MSPFPFRGGYGHSTGKRPWITADEVVTGLMTDIVGKYKTILSQNNYKDLII